MTMTMETCSKRIIIYAFHRAFGRARAALRTFAAVYGRQVIPHVYGVKFTCLFTQFAPYTAHRTVLARIAARIF